MGDTGSLILGLLLSILVIEFNEKNLNVKQDYFIQASPAVSFAILIIPIFDMLRVMFIRFFLRKPILQPDKRHIHHKFLEFGFSHKKIVVILMLMNLAFIIFSFYLSQYLSIRRLLLVIFLVAIFVFYIPTYLSQKKSRKKL